MSEHLGREITRTRAKGLGLGLLYGMGTNTLAATLGVDPNTADELRRAYWQAMPGLEALQDDLQLTIGSGGHVTTFGGRRYTREEPVWDKEAEKWRDRDYTILNTIVQGSAADVTKMAMIAYDEHPNRRGRLLLSVHDELVVLVKKEHAEFEMALLRSAMESVPLKVPLLSTGKSGASWGEATDVKEESNSAPVFNDIAEDFGEGRFETSEGEGDA
jgi:DNA polymerase-1